MDELSFTSVGIDIGTSTTKLIVSRLRLGRVSGAFHLPRYEIVERELHYASPIYTTPLLSQEEIDMDEVARILRHEYAHIGLSLSEVKSGAVIITGETATKANACRVVHYLAERSGDFVVAAAGADLEGLLAGKGSGAEQRSREFPGVVANVDIGGGTANVAYFREGKAIGTVTFHVGGRLIRLGEQGLVHSVSPHLQKWLLERRIPLTAGRKTTPDQLKAIASAMFGDMLAYLAKEAVDPSFRHLIAGSPPAGSLPEIDELMISGGISTLMADQEILDSLDAISRYGDFGPLLASSLRQQADKWPFRIVISGQTVRATVIGAGMQSVEISGSTVHIDPAVLPLRNIPVLHLEYTGIGPEDWRQAADEAMLEAARYALPEAEAPYAIALSGAVIHSYSTLQMVAEALLDTFTGHFPDAKIMVVVCEHDMAKALGQALSIRCGKRLNIVSIDQIRVERGDYIDIGEPLPGILVPVVIKTLAFS
ncbi:ethanolamine ammonia-lyase reactivating factor EutA [Paenibacillus durus]|uniref:Ethanolamine utilization protein n=1 Tax=Paenibacillus durus ATCC 35681 TaxID=1333534 RepID=A0A0F7F678_PAEDU|nr:ethanolamine ammonia-lyase reactivating factor EutA [Paenibacillus durus]AKG33262.1 ethanolamine utilization protein [Paenibacillus durus ATCC 35681]